MPGNVPGWTARGHAGYWGYAWYRIHVRIESAPGVDLALAGPGQVDDAYQLFDDGTYVGAFGNFSSPRPRINYGQPMMFPLSRAADSSAGASMRVIAFRVWMQPQTLTQAVVRLILSVFLLYVVVKGIREQGLEGWLVLPAVILMAAAEFTRELQSLGVRTVWFPFHVQITLPVASRLLLILVLAILLLRRLILSIRSQRLLALDVKQAQEVQRVILPESRTAVPGLLIESEYRPARQVGGDFFQIIPHPTDGSLLVVAGDVAGKGLQAGMLVALLVGAIRSTAETTSDPLALLEALNRRLLGRNEAHATCMALRISADGGVTLANAGHVPPFLNGALVAVDGALPLGVMEGADFSVTRFMLQPNDRLVLASDGLAEAMNPERQLFGFDRVQALVRDGKTASELANAVQLFGQEDDISVIAVTREAMPAGMREEPVVA